MINSSLGIISSILLNDYADNDVGLLIYGWIAAAIAASGIITAITATKLSKYKCVILVVAIASVLNCICSILTSIILLDEDFLLPKSPRVEFLFLFVVSVLFAILGIMSATAAILSDD